MYEQANQLDGANGFIFYGENKEDFAGSGFSSGDVNGDGYSDIIIASHGAEVGDKANVGKVYVIFGKATGWTASITVSGVCGDVVLSVSMLREGRR